MDPTRLSETQDLEQQVREVPWYHTLELPGGVVTPGTYDIRPALRRLPLPTSLNGQRCLDVGTHDGFWAFEMERRGASEVIALDLEDPADLDWPQPPPEMVPELLASVAAQKQAFRVAHRALDSKVDRRDLSVYDLDPALVGTFDFATIGTLLLHLRDPIAALTAIGRVVSGRLLVNEAVALGLSMLFPRSPVASLLSIDEAPFWTMPNVAGLRRYVRAAGFAIERSGGPYLLPNGPGFRLPSLSLGRMDGANPALQLLLRLGSPHAWILARPLRPPNAVGGWGSDAA